MFRYMYECMYFRIYCYVKIFVDTYFSGLLCKLCLDRLEDATNKSEVVTLRMEKVSKRAASHIHTQNEIGIL